MNPGALLKGDRITLGDPNVRKGNEEGVIYTGRRVFGEWGGRVLYANLSDSREARRPGFRKTPGGVGGRGIFREKEKKMSSVKKSNYPETTYIVFTKVAVFAASRCTLFPRYCKIVSPLPPPLSLLPNRNIAVLLLVFARNFIRRLRDDAIVHRCVALSRLTLPSYTREL